MLISDDYNVKVLNVSENIQGIKVALIDLPYREFPSLILFKLNSKTNEWDRVFEGLAPGIQDNPSNFTDLHTVGLGIDFTVGGDTLYCFNDEKVKLMIDVAKQSYSVIIPYQKFIHMHSTDSTRTKFESYTIDKTNYFDYANQLFNNKYNNYPKAECMMFDHPGIIDFNFNFIDGKYNLIVNTDNFQIWNYTFDGIDDSNQYLVNKQIKVGKAR